VTPADVERRNTRLSHEIGSFSGGEKSAHDRYHISKNTLACRYARAPSRARFCERHNSAY
jgi:hypothetical protein